MATVRRWFRSAMRIPLAHIEADLRSNERFGAIGELVSKLVGAGAFLPEAEPVLLRDIKRRESVMSTGIGFGIALPHAFSRVAKEPVAAFGLSRKGIEYASLDGLPVSIVFLYVVPLGAAIDEHTKLLGRIAGALQRPNALRRCTTASEIKAILDRFIVE
jgi:mannitol/fructose-specific phosphotransferase system IIA component (Ntr-type)